MKNEAGLLRKTLGQIFNAFAYQHSGEMLSLSRKCQILSDDLTKTVVKDNQSDLQKEISFSKRILLAFDKDIENELIKYSIGAAESFNARIDILTSLSKEEINRIMNKELKRQIVPWNFIKLETELLEGIADYTSSHSNVVFMVTSQHQALTDHYIKTKHAA